MSLSQATLKDYFINLILAPSKILRKDYKNTMKNDFCKFCTERQKYLDLHPADISLLLNEQKYGRNQIDFQMINYIF